MIGLLLLSGGIDSPVAGWLMMRKMEIAAIHFYTAEFTGTESLAKARTLARHLGIKTIYTVDASKAFAQVVEKAYHKYYFIFTKRLMLRTAELIARREGMEFLITGESIGQVASQTLKNLEVITEAVSMPVARPLLAMGKDEIIKIARKIGTLETSEGKEFCDFLGPKTPATGAKLDIVKNEEKKLEGIVETLAGNMKKELIG